MRKTPWAALVLAITSLSACGKQSSLASDGPLTKLYAEVPDSAQSRMEVDLTNYAGLAKAIGLKPPTEKEFVPFAAKLEDRLKVPVAFWQLLIDDKKGEFVKLGFPIEDVETTVSVAGAIHLHGIKASDIGRTFERDPQFGKDLRKHVVDGKTYYSWEKDVDPLVPSLGISSTIHVAATAKRSAVATYEEKVMQKTLSAAKSSKRLGSWETGVSAVREAEQAGSLFMVVIDRSGVRAALGDTEGPTAEKAEPNGYRTDPDMKHVPEVLLAIGIGSPNGKPSLILVYAHKTPEDAQLHSKRFTKLISEGSSSFYSPWSSVFTDPSIKAKGSLMVAVLPTENPHIGFESLFTRDDLV